MTDKEIIEVIIYTVVGLHALLLIIIEVIIYSNKKRIKILEKEILRDKKARKNDTSKEDFKTNLRPYWVQEKTIGKSPCKND